MNTIPLAKLKQNIQQQVSAQSNSDMDYLWAEYLSEQGQDEDTPVNVDVYVDWLLDTLIQSSSQDGHCVDDYNSMLYHITVSDNNKRVNYVFDPFEWDGNKEALDDIVLPVLDKLKFI